MNSLVNSCSKLFDKCVAILYSFAEYQSTIQSLFGSLLYVRTIFIDSTKYLVTGLCIDFVLLDTVLVNVSRSPEYRTDLACVAALFSLFYLCGRICHESRSIKIILCTIAPDFCFLRNTGLPSAHVHANAYHKYKIVQFHI